MGVSPMVMAVVMAVVMAMTVIVMFVVAAPVLVVAVAVVVVVVIGRVVALALAFVLVLTMAVIVIVIVIVLMHAAPVVVVAVAVVLLGHHLVALEQAHAQQQRQRYPPLHRAQDAGVGLDAAQLAFQVLQARLVHQVALVEQDHVAVHDLCPAHLAFEGVRPEVFGVHQGDDRVEPGGIPQVAAQEGHRHRQRIRQPGGLHHQIVHRFGAIEDPVHRVEQLSVDRAADAAVAQLHHVLAGGHHEVVVDADLAELIHQNGRLHALLVGEDVVEQRGLACTEEPGEDRDG